MACNPFEFTRAQLEAGLAAAAGKYSIDPGIAYRQIQQESNFNPCARSSSNAQGIAQFIPGTAARFGLTNPYDPFASFEAWGQYMRLMLDKFVGRYDIALAGYNSGENRSEYDAAAREGRCIRWEVMPARVQSETRNYVRKILGTDCQVSPLGGSSSDPIACFEGDPCYVDPDTILPDLSVLGSDSGGSMSGLLLIGLGLGLIAIFALKN